MSTLTVCHLGPTAYRDGLRLQEGLIEARAAGRTGDWVLYPDHPPVLTVGRNPSPGALRVAPEALADRGIELFEVRRGGDITYHGPGQLVGYLILDLESRGRDLHRLLRGIEEVLIRALARYGIVGERSEGRTGVWVGGEKLASIGVAVRRWVSYHGFALNVSPNLADFDLIHPCGLRGIQMTSLEALRSGGAPALDQVRQNVTAEIATVFGFDSIVQAPPSAAWQAAGNGLPGASEPKENSA